MKTKPCVAKPSFLCCVVLPSSMGDGILSTLSAVSSSRPTRSDPPQASEDPHMLSFVDDVAVEVITVTDYSEVELGARGEIVHRGSDTGSPVEGTAGLPGQAVEDGEEEEKAVASLTDVVFPERSQERQGFSPGPHDCPHCKKKFKFASSLTAHRVVHTGERPHCCGECGRRFSFRQSLDRHRHTHETFPLLSAYSERKRKRGEEGNRVQRRHGKEFSYEPTLMKQIHDDDDDDENDPNGNRTSESCAKDLEAVRASEPSQGVPPAKVRTSGRKRKPTMKIQALNSKKGAHRGKKSSKTGLLTPDW